MKSIIISIVIAITFSCFITGCRPSTPMGNDPAVKSIVIALAMQEYRASIVPGMYRKVTGTYFRYLRVRATYQSLTEASRRDGRLKKVLKAIDENVAKTKISLTNIRTDYIEEDIGKSYSSADLIVNKRKYPVKYTAQCNSEGKVYIEVEGLNQL